jgi:DNA polymerase theta
VEGFFGGYSPPGGFEAIDVAVCTIEKANSIVNKLLEQGKLSTIGMIVVDEIHLISDRSRGYILELLLAKVLYASRKLDCRIQIVTMSATLPNTELLTKWLEGEFFYTDYRPIELREMIKIGDTIYDNQMNALRKVDSPMFPARQDQDNVAHLCLETILEGYSVIVFCPTKDWCEKLSMSIANCIRVLLQKDDELAQRLKGAIDLAQIEETKLQFSNCPTGLDRVLGHVCSYGIAFHHAGLTTDERDIIESAFKTGGLRVIVATSTLSSGVNLPARRVIIRSPMFGPKQMSPLTYKQMIGRAGRKGKDTLGESLLICTEQQERVGRNLVCAKLDPIKSCLCEESNVSILTALFSVSKSCSKHAISPLPQLKFDSIY